MSPSNGQIACINLILLLTTDFQLKELEEEKKGPNCIECLLSIRFFNRKLK